MHLVNRGKGSVSFNLLNSYERVTLEGENGKEEERTLFFECSSEAIEYYGQLRELGVELVWDVPSRLEELGIELAEDVPIVKNVINVYKVGEDPEESARESVRELIKEQIIKEQIIKEENVKEENTEESTFDSISILDILEGIDDDEEKVVGRVEVLKAGVVDSVKDPKIDLVEPIKPKRKGRPRKV